MPAVRVTGPANPTCPRPTRAMVLTAGFGSRMMPLTAHTPKPLIPVLGETLLDRLLDRLDAWGIERVVLNAHHLAAVLRDHIKDRSAPPIAISDETDRLLDTGGGVHRALPLLGDKPFFVLNGDVLWRDGPQSTFSRLWSAFDPARLDIVLLLHPTEKAHGYDGPGDFSLSPSGLPLRRGEARVAPYVYAGVQLIDPRLFADVPDNGFSMNLLFDRALARGRMGAVVHDGSWYHVGTPQAVLDTERLLTRGDDHI